ncbi:DUF1585 domain-containing protein [Pseudobacteriovorax antillogorgiicola]|uniref:DUF1585 domain-containing protein n=1 Tax=Pseudobacteriovorax antillogorgiicola TaxID=1513793 RepID=A0A1Y6CBR9_9BACT|nr:DUF1585 domain-containing protein [Pseudobacteriovorax antillogorgiicola]TCS48608.1 uncharacterized protein DUF1585 [Pseudobacteriovorax antillogorgiicola]SMF55515.1 Protein of unknown function [Pseudobacteriovorax antillogorgiicola]
MRPFIYILIVLLELPVLGQADYNQALRRAQYLLNGTIPTDDEFTAHAASDTAYRDAVRQMILDDRFYDAVLRYHQRIFGVGLPDEYLEELLNEDIDGKQDKFASITCWRSSGENARFRCTWTSQLEESQGAGCPSSWETATSVFWYPGISAWVCPSVLNTCGHDLSKCFIQYWDENEAKNSELGTTETFDSRFAVINSLSKQAAGIATAVAVENYPYTKILEPGLTAVDGAIAHFYLQDHHFKIDQLNLNPQVLDLIPEVPLTDTRFKLIKAGGDNYARGGVISSFGWLRRYDKHRTRANELYKRLLCRNFTADLPAVFPQDPGNLREAPGCSDCHSVLDPMADFFLAWGEGAEIYEGQATQVDTFFGTCQGSTVQELAGCIQNLPGFGKCTVQNVWEWFMGRGFYNEEEALRDALANYFQTTDYSFRELVYAIATHPAFIEGTRSDAIVTDPLADPPLGEIPTVTVECNETIDYATHIQPLSSTYCENCHSAGSSRQDLTTEAQWQSLGSVALGMMRSGVMPPNPSSSELVQFADNVQCWLEQ